jgi:hypothetical protein
VAIPYLDSVEFQVDAAEFPYKPSRFFLLGLARAFTNVHELKLVITKHELETSVRSLRVKLVTEAYLAQAGGYSDVSPKQLQALRNGLTDSRKSLWMWRLR